MHLLMLRGKIQLIDVFTSHSDSSAHLGLRSSVDTVSGLGKLLPGRASRHGAVPITKINASFWQYANIMACSQLSTAPFSSSRVRKIPRPLLTVLNANTIIADATAYLHTLGQGQRKFTRFSRGDCTSSGRRLHSLLWR